MNIEIHQIDASGCNGYTIWQKDESKVVASQVWEDALMDLLTEKQFKKFEDGAFEFSVPNRRVFDALGVMA